MYTVGGSSCSSDNCRTWQTSAVNLVASSRENILQCSAGRSKIEQNQSSFQWEFEVTWALFLALWGLVYPSLLPIEEFLPARLLLYNWDLRLLGLLASANLQSWRRGSGFRCIVQLWSAPYESNIQTYLMVLLVSSRKLQNWGNRSLNNVVINYCNAISCHMHSVFFFFSFVKSWVCAFFVSLWNCVWMTWICWQQCLLLSSAQKVFKPTYCMGVQIKIFCCWWGKMSLLWRWTNTGLSRDAFGALSPPVFKRLLTACSIRCFNF